MLRATVPIDGGRVATQCERRSDISNGQQWWVCDHCGSLWHEMVNGPRWLPLSCPDRKSLGHQQQKHNDT